MLTAATLLFAKMRKLEELPTLEERISKVRYMLLISKLYTLCRYRAGYD